MPELPEVETVCRGLEPHLKNKTVKKVTLNRSSLRYPIPSDFIKKLENATVTHINRRSKYIEIHLSNGYVWLTHLGMTGIYLLCEDLQDIEKHVHIIIHFEDVILKYVDPRRFGYVDILKKEELDTSKYYRDLGPEPFSDKFNEDYIQEKLENSKKPIKTLLMDNSFVVGVGNIYANEILFALGIDPTNPANNVKKQKLLPKISENYSEFPKSFRIYAALKTQITDTLNNAIKVGGSTISDFKAPNSTSGYFPIQFQVYGRENDPCPICKQPIKRIQQSGRSTFYCKKCQK